MRAHHDANVQGGGVISNACPICGYFTNVLAQWLPWDGKFLRTTPEEAEKIRQRFTTDREERAQLDALINRLNQRLTPNIQSVKRFTHLLQDGFVLSSGHIWRSS